MEKAKNDYKPGRSLLKKIMIFLAICILVIFGLVLAATFAMMFILEQTRSGEFVEELPLELVPTAEYLLNHPLPTPAYLAINDPKPTIPKDKKDITPICVRSMDGTGLFGESRFFVNGTRLPDKLVTRSFLSGNNIDPRYETPGSDRSWACIDLSLKKGLHLIAFMPSVLSPRPTYQWVIEIK